MPKVLVAYATVYGSTQGVAEAIAETFRTQELEADVLPAGDVRSLDGYSAVVLGTAMYFFLLRPEAKRFLARNRAAIAGGVPIALFALGPFTTKPEELEAARKPVDKLLESSSWLKPVSVRIFGGQHQPEKLRFPHTMMRTTPASDARDWDDIRAWALELAEAFKR